MRRWVIAAGALGSLACVVATAPFYTPLLGLGPPAPPPRERIVTLSTGASVNVVDEGAGPAVVLIHGMPGSAYDWRPLPERLVAAGFHVLRYDRVGYGHSARRLVDAEHRLDTNARELLLLLSELEVESPVLVGWSYGGGVALRAAEEGPGRVRAILLLGSIGPDDPARGLESAERVLVMTEPLQRWGIATGVLARPGIRRTGQRAFSGPPPPWWTDHTLAMLALPGAVHTWMMETAHMDRSVLHAEGGSHMLPNTHADLVVDEVRKLAPGGLTTPSSPHRRAPGSCR